MEVSHDGIDKTYLSYIGMLKKENDLTNKTITHFEKNTFPCTSHQVTVSIPLNKPKRCYLSRVVPSTNFLYSYKCQIIIFF